MQSCFGARRVHAFFGAAICLLAACSPLGSKAATGPTTDSAPAQSPAAQTPGDAPAWVVPIAGSPARGPSSAPVTIVEFVDLQCPFCSAAQPTIRQLMADHPGQIRWVMKNNPLPFHRYAQDLALFTFAVREQQGDERYWQAIDTILNLPEVNDQTLVQLSQRFGLDQNRYAAVKAQGGDHPALAADRDLAIDLLAEGTPYFFVNGQRIVGAQPIEEFEALVSSELTRVSRLLQATPSADPYALIQKDASPPPGLEQVEIDAPDPSLPSWGPENAPVVVQMFSDFECGFCQRVLPTLRELLELHPGQLRVVWRNLPLSFHRHARFAARVALEVRAQKGDQAFWQFADRMYGFGTEAPEPLSRNSIGRYALEAGLELATVDELARGQQHEPEIARDLALADRIGATGTPTFVINGYRLVGAQPLSRFERLVKLALEKSPKSVTL
ncbi:MAG TPA: DsbA family protein [Polyangiaceae bacterium]|nr:DsbA family protein [Polyangiaceae bacterium]